MRCFSGVLDFSRVFPRVHDTSMLVSTTRLKTQKKCKKNARKKQIASPTQEHVFILHYAFGKTRVSCVYQAFCSRFARVLLTNVTKTQTQRIVKYGLKKFHPVLTAAILGYMFVMPPLFFYYNNAFIDHRRSFLTAFVICLIKNKEVWSA